MGGSDLNPMERTFDLGVAAMARVWAVEEALIEFVVHTKYPEGPAPEEWRQKIRILREQLEARGAALLPEVRQALFGQSTPSDQDPK